ELEDDGRTSPLADLLRGQPHLTDRQAVTLSLEVLRQFHSNPLGNTCVADRKCGRSSLQRRAPVLLRKGPECVPCGDVAVAVDAVLAAVQGYDPCTGLVRVAPGIGDLQQIGRCLTHALRPVAPQRAELARWPLRRDLRLTEVLSPSQRKVERLVQRKVLRAER